MYNSETTWPITKQTQHFERTQYCAAEIPSHVTVPFDTIVGRRKNYGSEALTLLFLISAYYVFWTLRNHPLSNRIYELFTLKMCLSTFEQFWTKNTSIKFEHWPLDEIPTLLSYMISQKSSAVTLLARVVHGDSYILDNLWIPQIYIRCSLLHI